MKQSKKLLHSYTINLDDDTSAMLEKLAQQLERKPRELLRILIVPTLCQEWAKVQRIEHPENTQPLQVAKFEN